MIATTKPINKVQLTRQTWRKTAQIPRKVLAARGEDIKPTHAKGVKIAEGLIKKKKIKEDNQDKEVNIVDAKKVKVSRKTKTKAANFGFEDDDGSAADEDDSDDDEDFKPTTDANDSSVDEESGFGMDENEGSGLVKDKGSYKGIASSIKSLQV